jgi:hypothetical protein
MSVLAGLLLWSAAHAGLPQFRDKAMPIRLACSPIAAVLVPSAWWLVRRGGRRRLPFPYTPSLLVTLPLIIDLAGNATGLYDGLEYFDDAVHFVNPLLLVTATGLLLARTGVPRWTVWIMAFGLGCAGNIAWELMEYVLMEGVGAVALQLSLRDTLSDQAWGVLGAVTGATVAVVAASRARTQPVVEQPLWTSDEADRPPAARTPVGPGAAGRRHVLEVVRGGIEPPTPRSSEPAASVRGGPLPSTSAGQRHDHVQGRTLP